MKKTEKKYAIPFKKLSMTLRFHEKLILKEVYGYSFKKH